MPHDDTTGLLESSWPEVGEVPSSESLPLDPSVHPPLDAVAVSREQDRLVNTGELTAAAALLSNWIAERPSAETQVQRLELARILFWCGRPREAAQLLERLLQERPGDSWISSFLGQVEARLGHLSRALSLFESARDANPWNHEAQLFLGGDVARDAERVRRLLTHGVLSPRGRIELTTLCAAIDFRRGYCISIGRGELTQASLDRANLLLDCARPGEDVDVPTSLRAAFLHTERIVFYTSHAFGDTLLGLAVVSALQRFFDIHPEARRPIEIISPYADVLEGLAENDTLISVRALCAPRAPDEASRYADDLRSRRERTVALTNSGPDVSRALADAAADHQRVLATVDLFIDRYASNIAPWQSLVPPLVHLCSYPSRLHRLMEMVLGCKLMRHPAEARVELPLSRSILRKRAQALSELKLVHTRYHAVVENASKPGKRFDPGLLRHLLVSMASDVAARERERGTPERILFCADPDPAQSFLPALELLPTPVRRRIIPLNQPLPVLAGLFSGATTLISTDTGLAHLGGAVGRPILILHTLANPFLWTTGGPNVHALWTRQALAAHVNQTPVNMQEWERREPTMAESISSTEIVDAWRRLCRLAELA